MEDYLRRLRRFRLRGIVRHYFLVLREVASDFSRSEGSRMKRLLELTWAEFLRMLKSPASLYFILGILGFLGFVFWLMATYFVAYFVDFAYLVLPFFLLALASTLISQDRESGFSAILFTYPISSLQYYLSKFLSLYLMAGLYLLILLPFNFLIVTYAGIGWSDELLLRVAWTLVITGFVGALGLLISASVGRRATLPSVSIGFAVALVLVFAPFLMVQYMGALDPSGVSTALALLHTSPLMGAFDFFHSHAMIVREPLYSLLLSSALAVFLVATGTWIHSKLQSPEGWEVSRQVRLMALGTILLVLVAVPLIPPYDYVRPQVSGDDCFSPSATAQFCVGLYITSSPGPFAGLQVGFPAEGEVIIGLSNAATIPLTLAVVSASWSSDYLTFNVTSASFTSIVVQAATGGENVWESAFLRQPVVITPLRSSALGTSGSAPAATVITELTVEGQGFLTQQSIGVVGSEYDRDMVWIPVIGIAVIAVSINAFGRWRGQAD